MKKYINKKTIMALAGLTLLAMPMAAQAVSLGFEYTSDINLGTRDIRSTISAIINVLLGFLGVIAVVIILLGGFKWMTAGGGEDKIGEAKKLITAGIIGLIIILAAYAIAQFVIEQLASATE